MREELTLNGRVKPVIWLLEKDPASAKQIRSCIDEAKYEIINLNPDARRYQDFRAPNPNAILFAEDTCSLNVRELQRFLDLDRQGCFLVVLASNPPIDRVIDALIEGGYAYLTKPVQGVRLRRVLEKGLESRRTFEQIIDLAAQVQEYGRQLHDSNLTFLRARQELEEKERQIHFLHELGLAISSSLNRNQIVKGVFARLKSQVPVQGCRVRLFPGENGEPVWTYAVGSMGKDAELESVSLTVRGKCIGIFEVKFSHPCRPGQRGLLETAALQMAMALQNATHHDLVKRLADNDHLTGLDNRRSFERHLTREFQRCSRYHEDLALIFCDLDHFKLVNDRYGHQVGDEVLRQIARLMVEGFRGCDYAARWGGDEFAVILPKTTKEQALISAERLYRNLQEHLARSGLPGEVSLSIGIADTRSAQIGSKEDLIASADEALFQAKKEGRNRIRLYEVPRDSEDGNAAERWSRQRSRAVA